MSPVRSSLSRHVSIASVLLVELIYRSHMTSEQHLLDGLLEYPARDTTLDDMQDPEKGPLVVRFVSFCFRWCFCSFPYFVKLGAPFDSCRASILNCPIEWRLLMTCVDVINEKKATKVCSAGSNEKIIDEIKREYPALHHLFSLERST